MFNLAGWTVSLTLIAMVILGNYPFLQADNQFSPLQFGLYDALSRVAWAIALCYIIFACTHNGGGPINWFLSHTFWKPISRLSYALYLVHVLVMGDSMGAMTTVPYFTEAAAVSFC